MGEIFIVYSSGYCSSFIVHFSFVIVEWRGFGNDK